MADRRVRPIAWAKQEDVVDLYQKLVDLNEQVADLEQRLGIIATGYVEVMSAVLELQQSLYGEPDEGPEPEDDRDYEPGYNQSEPDGLEGLDEETVDLVNDNRAEQIESPDELGSETAAEREARIAAVRARRQAALREQFEQGNETPEAAMTDPNDIVDIPDEGIVVGEGFDPLTGEPSDTADPGQEYDER